MRPPTREDSSNIGSGIPLLRMQNVLSRDRRHAVAQLVEALHYKPEGRGIESQRGGFFFNLPNPSVRTMALGSTQPLTEMSNRNLTGR
jgi:hypothetical protein